MLNFRKPHSNKPKKIYETKKIMWGQTLIKLYSLALSVAFQKKRKPTQNIQIFFSHIFYTATEAINLKIL